MIRRCNRILLSLGGALRRGSGRAALLATFVALLGAGGVPAGTFSRQVSLSFVYPLMAPRISSGFGMRVHPIRRFSAKHSGIDLAAPQGAVIRAVASGTIVYADKYAGYGNLISINHGKELTTMYGHLSAFRVHTGQHVNAGQIIGAVGSNTPTEAYRFPAEGVRAVTVRAGDGNDVIDLALATAGRIIQVVGITPVNVPAFVDGGLGDDQVFGGNARDSLFGGAGRDRLHGMGGPDALYGGRDHDSLEGGEGNDLLLGNAGNDRLNGGAGDDQLLGGEGDDILGINGTMLPLLQEPGNDLLVGGPGDDALAGGEGADRIFGGPGRDRFWNGDAPSEYMDLTPEDVVGPLYLPIS